MTTHEPPNLRKVDSCDNCTKIKRQSISKPPDRYFVCKYGDFCAYCEKFNTEVIGSSICDDYEAEANDESK